MNERILSDSQLFMKLVLITYGFSLLLTVIKIIIWKLNFNKVKDSLAISEIKLSIEKYGKLKKNIYIVLFSMMLLLPLIMIVTVMIFEASDIFEYILKLYIILFIPVFMYIAYSCIYYNKILEKELIKKLEEEEIRGENNG